MARLVTALATAMAFFALSATPAFADFEVMNEGSGTACDPVSLVGTTVSGGCVAEDLVSSGPVSVNGWWECRLNLGDMHVDAEGSLYTKNMQTSNWKFGLCGTEPCYNASKQQIPWPGQIREVGSNEYVVDLDICLRHSTYGQVESDTVTMSIEATPETLELSQEGFSEEYDLLHAGNWSTWNHDISIVEVEEEEYEE